MRTPAFPTTFTPTAFSTAESTRAPMKKRASSPAISEPIAIGADFSPRAEAAIEVASEFARKLNAPLALAHAVDMPRTLKRDRKASRWLMASRKRTLSATASSLRNTGLAVSESVRPESLGEALLQTAIDEKAQLIIIPAAERRRALGGMRRNATRAVIARARTPVLTLRETESLRAWLRGKRPLKVFVAYNFTTTSEAALRWVKTLTRAGPLEVVLGYVNHPVDDYFRIGARGPMPFGDNPPDVLEVLERDMKARADAVLPGIPVRFRIEPAATRTDLRLAELAREEGADLIVAGSRQSTGLKRLLHGSVSRALLNKAGISLVVVPLITVDPAQAAKVSVKRHVLVATDFSATGNGAIPHALGLLSEGGVLTLMHVASLPPMVTNQSWRDFGYDAKLSLAATRTIADRLRGLVPAHAFNCGILVQTEVVAAADAGRAISQAAERLGVDVICLGSGSRGEIGRTLLGSVTRTVRSLTRRPLLVVPAPLR